MIGLLAGLRIVESTAACEYVPARTYSKHRAHSKAHWLRISKKWRKRYGMRAKPCVYQMGDMLIVHPALMPELNALALQMRSVGL